MKFGQFMSYYKKKYDLKTLRLVPRRLCLQRIKSLYWKKKLLKQPIYIRYVLVKLSKFVQISTQTSSDSYLQRIL